jgi:hypothetical protein
VRVQRQAQGRCLMQSAVMSLRSQIRSLFGGLGEFLTGMTLWRLTGILDLRNRNLAAVP